MQSTELAVVVAVAMLKPAVVTAEMALSSFLMCNQ
jgi:hypothetical protein